MKKKVYLAGPITGKSWAASEDWRDEVKRMALTGIGNYVDFFSPLRGKDYLLQETSIKDKYDEHIMSTSKSIMLRDSYDVRTADAVIVNLTGATRVSIGTVMEIAWAYERRIPIIAIIEEDGSNIHEHSMLNEAIWFRVTNVRDALATLYRIFRP